MIPVNTNYSKTEYQPFPHLSLQNFASITIQNNFTITVCREKSELLRWLDPVFLGGYHPTSKLSGIPTFTFIVSLTHRMDNI